MPPAHITTAYIHITNTYDRLSQQNWAALITAVDLALATGTGDRGATVLKRVGPCYPAGNADYQAAIWYAEIRTDRVLDLQDRLARLTTHYGLGGIGWAETTPRHIRPHADQPPGART